MNRSDPIAATGEPPNAQQVELSNLVSGASYVTGTAMCVEAKPLTLDHVLPIAVGGSNTIDNAQPLCAMCNSIKGVQHIDYR